MSLYRVSDFFEKNRVRCIKVLGYIYILQPERQNRNDFKKPHGGLKLIICYKSFGFLKYVLLACITNNTTCV